MRDVISCVYRVSSALIGTALFGCVLVYLFIFERTLHSSTAPAAVGRLLQSVSGHVIVKPRDEQLQIGVHQPRPTHGGSGSRRHQTKNEDEPGSMAEYNFPDTNHVPDADGHVNPHPFRYILIPSQQHTAGCSHSDRSTDAVYLLVYVHSAPKHRKRREIIRSTWGNTSSYATLASVSLLFVMGRPPSTPATAAVAESAAVQQSIEAESRQHGDIIQEDFVDVYRNLTHKAVAAMRWITENCFRQNGSIAVGPRFVLKTDDDAFVNMFAVLRHLRRHDVTKMTVTSSSSSTASPLYVVSAVDDMAVSISTPAAGGDIMCNFRSRRRVSRNGKWHSTLAERRHPFWPPFCLGLAYIVTGSLVPQLYRKSLDVPFLWLDDVYVTGFLPLSLGGRRVVRHLPLNGVYVGEGALKDRVAEDAVAAAHVGGSGDDWSMERRRSGAAARVKTRPEAMFSHVHNLQLFVDVWNSLLDIEARRTKRDDDDSDAERQVDDAVLQELFDDDINNIFMNR